MDSDTGVNAHQSERSDLNLSGDGCKALTVVKDGVLGLQQKHLARAPQLEQLDHAPLWIIWVDLRKQHEAAAPAVQGQ